MRLLLSAAAALSLTACLGAPGEPLSSTGLAGKTVKSTTLSARFTLPHGDLTAVQGTAVQGTTFRDQAVAEVAATVAYASEQANAVAEAGRLHDVVSAQGAAIELANAAALVQQRANEMQAASVDAGGQDCGCGGCDPAAPSDGVTQGDVDNAVLVSALAAEVGGAITDDLNPPSSQSCSQQCGCEGCSDVCTDVPGTVDESALAQDIQDASAAAAGCADASAALNGAVLG